MNMINVFMLDRRLIVHRNGSQQPHWRRKNIWGAKNFGLKLESWENVLLVKISTWSLKYPAL